MLTSADISATEYIKVSTSALLFLHRKCLLMFKQKFWLNDYLRCKTDTRRLTFVA